MAAIIDSQTVDGLGGLLGWRVVALYRIPLQAGSSVHPQIPSESNVQVVLETDPEVLHACLMYPAEPFRMGFIYIFIFASYLPSCILWENLSHISVGIKKTFVKGSARAH